MPTTVAADGAGTTTPAATSTDEVADAFAHGWFSDDAAFAQVALWGFALTAIGIGVVAAQPAGRGATGSARSSASCPFVVVLYFFFQNVNRLLPAAL